MAPVNPISSECGALLEAGTHRLLPHEAVFGGFLIITWARLTLLGGPLDRDALIYLGLIAVNLLLVVACWRSATPFRWRARLLFHPVAFNLVFPHMKRAIPRLMSDRFDSQLNAIDVALLGRTPAVAMQAWQHPALTEALSLFYLLFFPFLYGHLLVRTFGRLDAAQRFLGGLFTLYGLGFLGYSFFPAAGPWVAMSGAFQGELAGGPITHLNDAIVRAGSNGVDVFPSLHCAVSAYLLLFDRTSAPRRFWLCLLPCIGLWVSTLYLRYHYAIDVACGFALAALGLVVARSRFYPTALRTIHESGNRRSPADGHR